MMDGVIDPQTYVDNLEFMPKETNTLEGKPTHPLFQSLGETVVVMHILIRL